MYMENACGSREFWEERYLSNSIGWDLGQCSPPIQDFFDQFPIPKSAKILIPGAGNAYEAAHLFDLGYQNVHILDFAEQPLIEFRKKYPDFPVDQLHQEDFFNHQGMYDCIIEQTFFCALPPTNRQAYAKKIHDLLTSTGRLVGLMFNRDFEGGPPFGGSTDEYRALFTPYFKKIEIIPCLNSISPRLGSEVFIQLSQPV